MIALFKRLEMTLAVLSGVALMIMMILTFCDVIGRYGFNNSIFGTAEMIEFLMVIVIFAGVGFVTAGDTHIKVEIFEPWIKRRVPRLQRWTVLIFSGVVYAMITLELIKHAADSLETGRRTAVLDLPQWFIPAGAALFSVIGLALFVVAVAVTRGHPARLARLDHLDGTAPDDPSRGME